MTKGEAKKVKIIQKALDLFYKKGVENVTFQELASQVGLTQPAIYKYFEDRSALLYDCCIYAAQKGRHFIDKNIVPSKPAVLRLKGYIEGNLNWVIKFSRDANAILSMYYFAGSNAKIHNLHRQIDELGVKRIETLLIQCGYEKLYKRKRPHEDARLIHSLLVGEMLKAHHRPKELKFEARLHLVWNAIEKLIF